MDHFDQNLTHDIVANENNIEVKNEYSILTPVTEDKEDIYEEYTIYPLHEKKQNGTASTLYQMLKVNAAPIDNCNKDLDPLCFSYLFNEGKFGQFYDRETKITGAEFIKSRLTSKVNPSVSLNF